MSELNLPKPPEGYFWRVEAQSWCEATLELRRSRLFLPSVLAWRGRVTGYDLPSALESSAIGGLDDLKRSMKAQELTGEYHRD